MCTEVAPGHSIHIIFYVNGSPWHCSGWPCMNLSSCMIFLGPTLVPVQLYKEKGGKDSWASQQSSGTEDVIKIEVSFKLGATQNRKWKSDFLTDFFLSKKASALNIMALSAPCR